MDMGHLTDADIVEAIELNAWMLTSVDVEMSDAQRAFVQADQDELLAEQARRAGDAAPATEVSDDEQDENDDPVSEQAAADAPVVTALSSVHRGRTTLCDTGPVSVLSGCGAPIVDRSCVQCGRPVLLDAYCCAGGAGTGYHRAGFCVTGVDVAPQPRYPFHFVRADAVGFIAEHGHRFAAVHASPPCQAGTGPTLGTNKTRNAVQGVEHPRLIAPTRAALSGLTVPTVIENVQAWTRVGADLGVRPDVRLCGELFGLGVIRHRWFEVSNVGLLPDPGHRPHRGRVAGMRHGEWFTGPYFAVYGEGGGKGSVEQWQGAMGITWTSERRELAEAIPPRYTQWLGGVLLDAVESAAA